MKWLQDNWPLLAAMSGAFVVFLSTVANLFNDPDHDPNTPPPKWVQVLWKVIDVLSLVSRPGSAGMVGRASLPGLPSRDKEPPSESGSVSLGVVMAVALAGIFAALVMAGCSESWALKWKTAGIDAAKCAAPDVVNAAGDALIDIISNGASSDIDYKQLGIELATKYGVDAALCALGKAWKDLTADGMSRSATTRTYTAVEWLINHQGEWAK